MQITPKQSTLLRNIVLGVTREEKGMLLSEYSSHVDRKAFCMPLTHSNLAMMHTQKTTTLVLMNIKLPLRPQGPASM